MIRNTQGFHSEKLKPYESTAQKLLLAVCHLNLSLRFRPQSKNHKIQAFTLEGKGERKIVVGGM